MIHSYEHEIVLTTHYNDDTENGHRVVAGGAVDMDKYVAIFKHLSVVQGISSGP